MRPRPRDGAAVRRRPAAVADRPPPRPWTLDRLDLAGLFLLGASVLWTLVASIVAGGNAAAMVAVFFATAGAYAAGRLGARTNPVLVPAAVVGLAAILVVLSPVGTFAPGATAGAFGYANFKAAFFVQAAVAGLMVGVRPGHRSLRVGMVLAAAVFAVVAPLSGSLGATAAVVTLPLAGLVAARAARPRKAIAVWVLVFAVALTGTTALGFAFAGSERRGLVADAAGALGGRRTALWADAASLLRENPVAGVGPGRFRQASATARSDEDARWAHNDFLQQGAELGWVGLGLLVLWFGWAFARLAAAPVQGPALLAGVAVAALGIHASVDYVLHFPLLPAVAAALVGTAVGTTQRVRADGASLLRKTVKAAVLPIGGVRRRRPGDVTILLYHRVGQGDGEIMLPPDAFERQMALLSEHGEVITLAEAVGGRGGIVVTFDDGYRDFHHEALPVLERHRIPAVLYLATGLVDGSDGGLTWTMVKEAEGTGLVTVGSHTHGHADLSRATETQARDEMRRSQELIEDRLGVPCRHFAYPWAVGSEPADRAARRTFDTAALDAWRTNRRGRTDPYRLGRVPILRSDGIFFFRAKVAGMLESEALVYRLLHRGPWRFS